MILRIGPQKKTEHWHEELLRTGVVGPTGVTQRYEPDDVVATAV